jgi:hypothetical protein
MFAHVRALRSSSVLVQTGQGEDNSGESLCNRVVCAFRSDKRTYILQPVVLLQNVFREYELKYREGE